MATMQEQMRRNERKRRNIQVLRNLCEVHAALTMVTVVPGLTPDLAIDAERLTAQVAREIVICCRELWTDGAPVLEG